MNDVRKQKKADNGVGPGELVRLPVPRSQIMRLYSHGKRWVIGAAGPIWWYGGGIASSSLCDPVSMLRKEALHALPTARALLRKSNEAQY